MIGIDVRLTWPEVRHAAYIGIDRFAHARRAKRPVNHGAGVDDTMPDVLGAWGELALAKMTGTYWAGDLEKPDRGAPDVGPWHVRTASRTNDSLLLHPEDRDDEPFVLVSLVAIPVLRVMGWCLAADGKHERFWKNPTGRPGRDCYFVPPMDLSPVNELPEWYR